MKYTLAGKGIALSAIALGTLAYFSPSAQAQTTFFCGTSSRGIPTTYATTTRGNVPVIRWVSQAFSDSGYSPQARCQEVSSRFQTYYSQGVLNYITSGIMNGEPVICISSVNGGPCTNLLFTLKRGQNASRTLQQLFDVRTGAAGPLYESTGGEQAVYIDVKDYLNTAAVEQGASASTQPNMATPTTPSATPPATRPGSGAW